MINKCNLYDATEPFLYTLKKLCLVYQISLAGAILNCGFAIINDRLYETGEVVLGAGPASEALILKQVLKDKVLVSQHGQIVELKYQDFAAIDQLSALDTQWELIPEQP